MQHTPASIDDIIEYKLLALKSEKLRGKG